MAIGIMATLFSFLTYKFKSHTNTLWITLLIGIILAFLLGNYPVNWRIWDDRLAYANQFLSFKRGHTLIYDNDPGFYCLTYIFSRFLDYQQYFIAIALIYITNYIIAIKRLVGKKSIWLFTAVILSMGFTSYSINTMRAGLALSFLVLGTSFYPIKRKMLVFLILALSIHFSTIIPILMMALSYYYNKTKLFYIIWFLSVPISFVGGSIFMDIFSGFTNDQRVEYLNNTTESVYNTGFRIDFILYSLAPVAVGAYYIFVKKVKDRTYHFIYNTYLLTNVFWILVIRANYSDRFAYLSWFLIPFVLMYPLLKDKMRVDYRVWIGMIFICEMLFKNL